MEWQEIAAKLKFDDGVSWTQLPRELEKLFKQKFTVDQVRNKLRRHPRYNTASPPNENINSEIYEELKTLRKKQTLCENYKISMRVLDAVLQDLRDSGIQIDDNGETVKLCRDLIPEENHHKDTWSGERVIRFGVAGDKQFNSKYVQITHLHNFYDLCEKEGITRIFDPGDIDDGEQMRPGHQYECYNQGADDHIAEIIKNHPRRKGIITEFITGNHDHSLIKRAGYDIGPPIAQKRDDMIYLGQSAATIELTPNCTLELRHPIDGTAYAISYKTQKMLDAMHGGEKPNVLLIGHYHKMEYIFYRNVHAFQSGCFQAQTNWMKGKQIAAAVGGWIIELHVDDEGTITRCKGEFIPFYRSIKDDYLNWR